MSQESDASAVFAGRTELTPDQSRLVQEKISVLQEARELQSKLAASRAELTRIDAEMLNTDFEVPVLACW